MSIPATGNLRVYQDVLKRVIVKSTSRFNLLDLCCGETNHIRGLPWKSVTCVDVINWPARIKEAQFIHGDAAEYVKTLKSRCFDMVICSDGIEHFPRLAGEAFLAEMERVGNFCFIFTPLGPFGNVDASSTDPHIHKSAWFPADFETRGWQTDTHPNWHGAAGAFFAWKQTDL
jgi:hypothetical protein